MASNNVSDIDERAVINNRLAWSRISLGGWKSIRELPELELGVVNVLIGANGAGKSNLISFFRLLGSLADMNLQSYVSKAGGANSLLHCGAKITSEVTAELSLTAETFSYKLGFSLAHAAPDTLLLSESRLRTIFTEQPEKWFETKGFIISERGFAASNAPGSLGLLARAFASSAPFHFRDTSASARVRQRWNVDDGSTLKEDAANIAPFLMTLRDEYPEHYRLIVETIQQVMPFFLTFEFNPSNHTVMLQWRERSSDIVYSAYQASDGMLSIVALVTLLMQPVDKLPSLLIIDEPELGLHPFAIDLIAGLIRSVSLHRQVIVATQSETLLDRFEPSEIIVVERSANGESEFKRLDEADLRVWLTEYALSELWEKNVIGGRPK